MRQTVEFLSMLVISPVSNVAMNSFFTFSKAALGGLLLLSCGLVFSAPSALSVNYINVPAYNLITDTLAGMSSTVDGKRNDDVMQLICDLARGEKKQQEVNAILEKSHVDVQSIPAQGSISSLLINGDAPQQAATCAAYIATSLFYATDNTLLFDSDKKDSEKKKADEEQILNLEHFKADVKLKMSLAEATATLYAVIASNLKSDPRMTFTGYQQSVLTILYAYAPDYLRLVQAVYSADRASYTPVEVNRSRLDVMDNTGRELKITPQGVTMTSRGVTWLGDGKILGKEYFVAMKISDTSSKSKTSVSAKKGGRKN